MRLPDYFGVIGALIVGGVLTLLLLASTLGTPTPLPTRPTVTIPSLPTQSGNGSLPSALPSGTPIGSDSGRGTGIGQTAPNIRVTLTDGSLMDTSDFSGLPIWVNFMATWCPQCSTELPMMQRFEKDLKDQMTVLVIDVGEDRSVVRDFMRANQIDLTVGLDQDGSLQSSWAANALPVHFMLDADGVVRQIVYGGASEETFIEAVTVLVPEFSASE
ncbi:MAG TPA: TlpA disulfide reductase family protein [Candidatus Limnocylindria bacterium]|nr:TlpA disulfide reductase family protein [Candidatus Limnocylindria bacterium]